MILTLLNIVLPVFFVAALGFAFGRWHSGRPEMGFINRANIMLFCPALIFSALLEHPLDPGHAWPLIVAGVLIIIVPGLLLSLIRRPGVARPGPRVPGTCRNPGNIGSPVLVQAFRAVPPAGHSSSV